MEMFDRLKIFGFKLILKVLPAMAFFKANNLIFRLMGMEVHPTARIWSSLKVNGVVKIRVGKSTFIGDSCTFTGGESTIKIGDYCDISSSVSIVTGSHEIDKSGLRIAGNGFSKDVHIGNRVWVGYGVIILGNLSIGDNVIVAAGSVVTKNLASNAIYGGNPAKFIKAI
jgi:maltose O-acetyltransferase